MLRGRPNGWGERWTLNFSQLVQRSQRKEQAQRDDDAFDFILVKVVLSTFHTCLLQSRHRGTVREELSPFPYMVTVWQRDGHMDGFAK